VELSDLGKKTKAALAMALVQAGGEEVMKRWGLKVCEHSGVNLAYFIHDPRVTGPLVLRLSGLKRAPMNTPEKNILIAKEVDRVFIRAIGLLSLKDFSPLGAMPSKAIRFLEELVEGPLGLNPDWDWPEPTRDLIRLAHLGWRHKYADEKGYRISAKRPVVTLLSTATAWQALESLLLYKIEQRRK
jgi:hypothetical protein